MATTDTDEDLELDEDEEERKKRQPDDEAEPVGSPIAPAPKATSESIGGAIAPSGIAPLPRQPEETTSTPLGSTLEPPKSAAAPEPMAIGSMIAQPTSGAPRPAADRLAQLETRGPAVSQHHGFGGGLLKAADAIGNIIAPNATQWIPGTTSNYYNRQLPTAQKAVTDEDAVIASQEAEKDNASRRDLEAATADRTRNPIAKQGLTPEENTLHDLMTGNGGQPRINPQNGQPYTYLDAYTAVAQAKADTKPQVQKPAHISYDSGIPVSVTGADGKVYDVNDPKLPPELKPLVDSANRAHGTHVKEAADTQAQAFGNALSKQSKGEDFTEAETGRKNLTEKVETPYRDAAEKADTLRNVVQLAQGGNMEAAAVQPLMATLGLTTMEGVKRINGTELEAVAGAGDLFTKIQGKLGKWTAGQPLAPDLQRDITQLANMLQKNAYKKYSDSFDSTTKRYGLKDEQKLPGPQETSEFKAPAGAPNAPQEDGHKLKQNGQVIAISQGGKWAAPPAPPSK